MPSLAHPTVNRKKKPIDRLKASVGRVSVPGLFDNLDVVWGTPAVVGQGYAEYLPASESGPPGNPNPYQGRDTVAVNRDRVGSDEMLDEIILGDAMHRLPTTYPTLYRQFTGNQSPGYEGMMRERHKRIGDPRSYDQWLKTSGHDSMIRGAVLSDMPQHSAAGWGGLLTQALFSKEQYMALEDIRRIVRPEKKKE